MNKDEITTLRIVDEYKKVVIPMLKLSFPNLYDSQIEEAIDYSIIKRMKNSKAVLDNSYKHKKLDTSLLEMAEYIMSKEPILTSSGLIFRKHGEVPNPIAKLLKTFMDNRQIQKNEMYKYPKGSELYNKYNLMQNLSKIDANALNLV